MAVGDDDVAVVDRDAGDGDRLAPVSLLQSASGGARGGAAGEDREGELQSTL